MSQLVFDEATAKKLEALYRTRDVMRRRRLVREALAAGPGERVIDIGCGPGFYAEELSDDVGTGGSIVAVDGSEAMLAMAARRCEHRANVSFELADATSLPAEDASFDAAVSVQVMEYVADVERALAEARRVLRPGGRVVIWDVDWETLSWHSPDVEGMARAKRAWDGHLAHPSLPQRLSPLLRAAGFQDVSMAAHVFATNALDPESYLSALMALVADYLAGHPDFGPQAADALVAEQRALDERGEFYGAVVQVCFTASRAR